MFKKLALILCIAVGLSIWVSVQDSFAAGAEPEYDVIESGTITVPHELDLRVTIINSFASATASPWGSAHTGNVWDVAPTENVYELDDPSGSILQSWPSGWDLTSGLAPAESGHLWVAEWQGDTYAKYTQAGTQVTTPISTSFNIGDLAFDGTYLWTVDYWTDTIHKFDPATGNSIATFPAPGGTTMNGCRGIAYDPQHNSLWISRYEAGVIYQVDAATGSVLFSFTAPLNSPWGLGWDGKYLWASSHTDGILYQIDTGISQMLEADASTLSGRLGGLVNFTLNGGKDNGGRNYILLGCVSGTSPGTPLPGGLVTLPLNVDYFTYYVIFLMNSSIFQNFQGVLDNEGNGKAQLNTIGLGPLSPGCTGKILYFAYALYYPWDVVSNPVEIEIVE